MIKGENFIGSKRSSEGDQKFKTFDPVINQENEWEFTVATSSEIDQAAELAYGAFKVFRTKTDEERAGFLEAIADEIEAMGEPLLEVYMKECGMPIARAKGERGRTLMQLRSFAQMLKRGDWKETTFESAEPNRTPLPKPDLRKTYIPVGPVAVFGASNFPFAFSTAGGDTASAFAAGCPVLAKSHPMHAGTAELVSQAIIAAAEKTNMPEGVFSNLNSNGTEVGKELVLHPRVKAVGFTGSIRGGRAIYDLAAQREEPIPVFAEMGSINPVIISQGTLKNAREKWAKTYAGSITVGTGQFCTNPGLLIAIDSPELEDFSRLLANHIAEINPMVMLHPNIKASYSRLKEEVTTQAGVEVLTSEIEVEPNFADQAIITVSGAEFLENSKLHQEVFGPFSMIVKCKDEAEIIAIIEGLEGQLTGTIIAEEGEYDSMRPIAQELQQRVGRILFNGVPTGVEVCAGMQHGGPYPASTDSRFTAVGVQSVRRWIRPISFQNFPTELLPDELKNG